MNTIKFVATRAVLTGTMALFCLNFSWAGIPVQHWTQPSGVRVYLVESPAIPMVDVQIDLDAGGRRDPVDKPGLANLMASSTANGVRATATEPALDEHALSEAWADLGAAFAGSAGSDRMSFGLRSLTYPDLLDKAVTLAARQLGEPSFPQAPWLRDRPKLIASLKEADTRPATLAARAYHRAVYGNHPYGREMTQETLLRISELDFRSLHSRAVRACDAKVSVVGALNRAQADALVMRLMSRLPKTACVPQPAVPEVEPLTGATEQRVAFASAQAHVLLGQPGYQRKDADFFALTVGNHILGGGGFTSRLTGEVREKRGLTYSVYSYFSPGLHAGAFTIGLQTRPDQADQALGLVRDVLTQFVADGPTEKELQAAKDNLVGGFALRLDSNKKLLDNIANVAWNDLPLDYLDTWTQRVEELTAADVRAAFARKVQPARLAAVVLGAP